MIPSKIPPTDTSYAEGANDMRDAWIKHVQEVDIEWIIEKYHPSKDRCGTVPKEIFAQSIKALLLQGEDK